MLDTLISSKTRIKLLVRFFLNPNSSAYLRGLEQEFGESSNAIRIELNRFEEAGLIVGEKEGNKKIFKANKKYPLFLEIRNIVLKHLGIDKIVDSLVNNLGEVHSVYWLNAYNQMNIEKIELLMVGKNIDYQFLEKIIKKAKKLLGKDIFVQVLEDDLEDENYEKFLIYKN
jgi:DNA-binding transcriptional ArsR family regulator